VKKNCNYSGGQTDGNMEKGDNARPLSQSPLPWPGGIYHG
jgi:hypothetical protein